MSRRVKSASQSMSSSSPVTGFQLAAARVLLGFGRPALAREAGVSVEQIAKLESQRSLLTENAVGLAAIRAKLEELGAQFIPENGGGAGVRLKFTRQEARQIGSWENEGGLAADDDAP